MQHPCPEGPRNQKTAERCANDVASCCVVFGCVVAWCVVLSSVVMCCAAASCPVLCCAVLCCVVLSCCAVLCCVVLSRLPCPVLSCLVLPCPVLPPSNPVLSLSVLSVCPSVCLSVCPSVRLWTRASGGRGGMGRNAPDLPEQDAVRLLADPRSVLERIRQSKLIWALSAEVGQATGARGGRCRSVQADNLQLPELTMEQTAEQTIAQQADPLHTHTHTHGHSGRVCAWLENSHMAWRPACSSEWRRRRADEPARGTQPGTNLARLVHT